MYLKDKTSLISVRISDRDSRTLTYLCKRLKKSKSDLIRFIIKSYLASLERVFNEDL